MRVLGIDPGLRITGYACVEGDAIRPSIVEAGVFRLVKNGHTPELADRLVELDADLRGLIERTNPDAIAIETMFTNIKHPGTIVMMAHGRGVVLLAARQCGVPILELKPAEVKKAATGSGRAEKGQMQRAMQDLFNLDSLPTPADLADALAIATQGLRRAGAPGAITSVRGV
ncbi:MAG: crossover junction endodeoxyribonuclease RuvC [Phycisphaerales bacterium]|nr:crossover junction endodeoxyribonuclease RuvC [Phycisphaerales bacterium]